MVINTVFIEQLDDLVDSFPPDSILSRTVFQDESIKVILFGFHPGQELSEHTAAVPALLHIIKGEARMVLGTEEKQGQAGTWVRIPPQEPHSIHAITLTYMLLYLLLD